MSEKDEKYEKDEKDEKDINIICEIKVDVKNEDDKAENKNKEDDEKEKDILIIYSRDITRSEVVRLQQYGNVLEYDDCHINIPVDSLIETFHPHYFLFDVRKKNHRLFLTKDFRSRYHIICMIRWYDLLEDFIEDVECDNVIKELPSEDSTNNQKEFDKTLLHPKIRRPNCCRNIFEQLLGCGYIYRYCITSIRSLLMQYVCTCIGAPPPVVCVIGMVT